MSLFPDQVVPRHVNDANRVTDGRADLLEMAPEVPLEREIEGVNV